VAHKYAVNDISWSHNNGRSFEMVASCGKDGMIIWFLRYDETKKDID